jgi:gluconate kinase
MKLSGLEFNSAAEKYYRDILRVQYMDEAFGFLESDFKKIDSWKIWRQGYYNPALLAILDGNSACDFLSRVKKEVMNQSISVDQLRKLISITLLTIHQDMSEVNAESS